MHTNSCACQEHKEEKSVCTLTVEFELDFDIKTTDFVNNCFSFPQLRSGRSVCCGQV